MKTKITTFRKLIKVVFVALILLGVQSCETEIPITDTEDPEFSFQITGDGFNRTFDQDTDFNRIRLNLRDNTVYQYTYTGTDSGGVELIQWQVDSSYIIFETPIERPWTARDISSLSRMIQWQGNPSNPLTGSVVTGRFRTNGQLATALFRFYVRDFGGESGVSNINDGELNLFIGNHNTEVIRL